MSFKRAPAIQCWVKHVLEGQYNENEKFFYTIFGQVKRIRIIATIIDKREKLIEASEQDMGLEDEMGSNIRIDFDLDDSTGRIRATIRNIDPDKYKKFNKGNIVEVMGRVSKFKDFVSLWIESMRIVEEPNLVLLRNAEIIKKIKSGEIQEVPEIVDDLDEFSDEIDVTTLFENETDFSEQNETKERIYALIEQTSAEGKGINFERLKRDIKISDNELRTILNDLILESRIYKSDNDNFEAF
ncbi:MAG: OB-fold nucleic acid binding domain-containing protein [Candidatus Hermodarchaeota archaeon]